MLLASRPGGGPAMIASGSRRAAGAGSAAKAAAARIGWRSAAAGAKAPRAAGDHEAAGAAPSDAEAPADALFTPVRVGAHTLKHRVVLPPLTRCRALGNVPQPAHATYYGQRATDGGLLIAEATCISPEAVGYPNVPGIWSDEQVAAWRPVVNAVHAKGGVFFSQIWHGGRASHPDFQPGGVAPVSASAIAIGPAWPVYTPKGGPFPYPVPRALELDEIPGIVDSFARAAKNAIAAGFDGVEIHAANGYLISQFISSGSNVRTDAYGGSVENRARLALEVVDAVAAAVGPERTAVRLSPFNAFLDCVDAAPFDTYGYIVGQLSGKGLAYLSLVEPRAKSGEPDESTVQPGETLAPFREAYTGVILTAGGFDRANGAAAVAGGAADLVAYGRWFISNPDLPLRFRVGAPLNPYNRDTFYGFDPVVGYTDYPALAPKEAARYEAAAAPAKR